MKAWKLCKSKKVFSSPPFNILENIFDKPNGMGNMKAFIIDCPNWVNIIGVTKERKVLLIKQFRFGTQKLEIEIPGGVIEKNEEPLEGAKRELEEETGYISEDWEQIGAVDANPAIMNNKVYTFLARNISAAGNKSLDPDEIIESEFSTFAEIDDYIKNGKITSTYIIAAFHWLSMKKNFLKS